MRKLSNQAARRLAIRAQRLAEPRPKSILEVVRDTGALQLDPTSAVARSEQLVLFSRLGRYHVRELDRLLWEDRALFQWRAFIYPREDWPLIQAAAKRYPYRDARGRRITDWLRANDAQRRAVLSELRRRGPLRQRELDLGPMQSWRSSGWTNERNVSFMLERLWAQGKVLVAGRHGQERIWDLAERVVPPAPALSVREAARVEAERRVRQLGVVSLQSLKRSVALWLLPLEDALGALVREGVIVPFEVERLRGAWFVHRDALDGGRFRGRTTVLSPFDPLIYDRDRAEALFSFRYRIEIYVPKDKREYGYFVLPILHGDRIVGRVDPVFDRKENVLRVNGLWWQDAPVPEAERALDELARWLGADEVVRT